jgi:hypothetical protein
MVPEAMVTRWEGVYRFYEQANQVAGSGRVNAVVVADMVRASREVAAAWRVFTRVEGLPWWALAAVTTAAQAFDAQAREWERRLPKEGERQ